MKANEHLAAICQQAAVLMQQRGGVDWAPGPPPRLTIETQVDGCRYRLRMAPTVEAAEGRAARLRRGVRPTEQQRANALPSKPSLSRAKYSQAVYDQFIADGEHENAEAYRGLYE